MRRDGDRLVAHLAGATQNILICAPFIKGGALRRILAAVPAKVSVRIVTRWLPKEVAVGVSDLEVFELAASRENTRLELFDQLHAKLYIADESALVGSANITGAALGWTPKPNLELLLEVSCDEQAVEQCIDQLRSARLATPEERDRVRELAAELHIPAFALTDDDMPEECATLWLPELAAPRRLYHAYLGATRDRLATGPLAAALSDLEALALPDNLTESNFLEMVASRFAAMPAIEKILLAAEEDLRDADGTEIIRALPGVGYFNPEQKWLIVREWITTFLTGRYEIAPETFVVRRKPGVRGS